jgi:hypothetical protein
LNEYLHEPRKTGGVQIAVFQYATALLFVWLLSGFWQLQVQSPEVYEYAENGAYVVGKQIVLQRRVDHTSGGGGAPYAPTR